MAQEPESQSFENESAHPFSVRRPGAVHPGFCASLEHSTFQNDPPTPQPLILTDQQGEYRLGRSMDILEDPSGELSIDQVASPEFASRFVRSQEDVPVFGYTNSAYWVRVPLRNESRLTNPWWLEFGYANTQYIDLYTPLPGGQGFSLKQSGSMRPFTTRDVPYQRVILSLSCLRTASKPFTCVSSPAHR